MKIDKNNTRHIIADEGKTFKRIINEEICANELWLGYIYQLDGVVLETPHLDQIEDFEEIEINNNKYEY